jgi:hypothetical protein
MRAGVMYMGGDSITEKKEARDLISMSVIGLILVLSPVIVFSIINPDILSLRLGAIKLDPVSSQGAQDPYASSVNQSASEVCSVAYTNPKIAPNTSANACSSLGSGYVGAPTACCKGLASSGICCAKQADSAAGRVVQAATNGINTALTACGINTTDQQKGCVVARASFVGQGLSSCTETKQICAAAVGKTLIDACVPAATAQQRSCVYAAFALSATPAPSPAPAAAVDYMWRMLMEKGNGTGRSVQTAGPFRTQKACQDSMTKFMSDNGLVQSDAVPQCDCSAPRSTFPQCKNG